MPDSNTCQIVSVTVSEREVLKLVLEFLEKRRLHITQVTLERETGVINGAYSDDVLFLRQLILDGQWDAALGFVDPLKDLDGFPFRKFSFLLAKYKYFELLCVRQEPGPLQDNQFAVEEIVESLKELEHLCENVGEFRRLCALLTSTKLGEHEHFKNWNPSSARLDCFHALLPLVAPFIDILNQKKESSESPNPNDDIREHSVNDRLVQLIVKGLFYESAITFCQQQALEGKNASKQEDEFSKLLSPNEKLSSADLALVSWLDVLSNEQFTIPFHQKSLNFRLDRFKKPSLEAHWGEQLLVTPFKPGGQFPFSLVPNSKPKFAQKMMTHSMTASLAFETGKRLCSSFAPQSMSQSTLPSVGAFSLIQQSPDSADVMRQSQLISEMLSESSINNTSNNSTNFQLQSLPPDSLVFQQNPHHELEAICRRTQMKLSLKRQKDKFPEQIAPEPLPSVPELITPREEGVLPQFVQQQPSYDTVPTHPMSQSRLFQEFQANWAQQQTIPEIYQQPPTQSQQYPFVGGHYAPMPQLTTMYQCAPQNVQNHPNPTEVVMRHYPTAINTYCMPPMSSRPTSMTIPPSALSISAAIQQDFGRPRSYLEHPPEPNFRTFGEIDERRISVGSVDGEHDEFVDEEEQLRENCSVDGNGKSSKSKIGSTRFVPVCCFKDSQAIRAVAFHPSGGHFAIGTNSRNLLICRYPNDKLQAKHSFKLIPASSPDVLMNRARHHHGSVYCAAFSKSGELLATGSNDKTIKLTEIRLTTEHCRIGAEMELPNVHDGTIRDVIFMEDQLSSGSGNVLLISGGTGNCRICVTNCETGRTIRSFQEHTAPILGLYNWGSSTSFVSCSHDKTIRFWDLRAANSISNVLPDLATLNSRVTSVCVDSSGKLLVSGHENASMMLFDIYGGRPIQIFRPHGDEVRTVRFSNAAYYLLSGSYDKRVVITDMRGNLTEPLSYLPVAEHRDKIIQCRWHPRDFVFLSTSADKSAVLWSLPS